MWISNSHDILQLFVRAECHFHDTSIILSLGVIFLSGSDSEFLIAETHNDDVLF